LGRACTSRRSTILFADSNDVSPRLCDYMAGQQIVIG
jgi:hypothetical protein